MAVRSSDEISAILRQQIEGFDETVQATNVGTIIEVGDGIARIWGLSNVMASELLEFSNGVMGMALNLEEDTVGAVIMGAYTDISEGDEVRSTGRVVQVPVGDALIGRVVDALGQPIDGKGPLSAPERAGSGEGGVAVATRTTEMPMRVVERIAPGVILRESVNTPVQTGIKAL